MWTLSLLYACSSDPGAPVTEAAVVAPGDVPPRTAPHGKATIHPLSEGAHAFVGRLELAPGAEVPAHRDDADEIIVVLAGHGTLTMDGTEHPVGEGTAVTMPAGAEVSYVNGVERLVALQVFVGPGPADKYAGWAEVDAEQWGHHAMGTVGPFTIVCSSPECTLWHRGEPVGDPVWHYGDPEGVLTELGGGILTTHGDAWLASMHAGDGCPVVYQALCLVDGAPVRTETFGNCAEPESVRSEGRSLVFAFVAHGTPEEIGHRRAQVATVDPTTCTVDTTPAGP